MSPLTPPTPGLRVMLWAAPTLTIYLGVAYLLSTPLRYASPAFSAAKVLLPMHWWGVVFVAIGLVNIGLIKAKRVQAALVSICVSLGFYVFWATLFVAATINPGTPLTAPAYPVFVVVLHVSMLMTLTGTSFHLPRWRRG